MSQGSLDLPEQWTLREVLAIYLKGIAMGAAGTIPGVSGGTIALIVGIYERLVNAIAAVTPRLLMFLPGVRTREGRQSLLRELIRIDLPFLLLLGAGVATAIIVVSRIMVAAFAVAPAHVNAFFFGLIAASAVVIAANVSIRTPGRVAATGLGFLLAFSLTGNEAILGHRSAAVVFIAGAISVAGMILPGISGAAFLYILGQYEYMIGELQAFIDALGALAIGGSTNAVIAPGVIVAIFILGAMVGLVGMARIVSWALARYRMATLGFLIGLMLGALRLPVTEIHGELGVPAPIEWLTLLAVVVIGIAAVLALEWYTDSLEYGETRA